MTRFSALPTPQTLLAPAPAQWSGATRLTYRAGEEIYGQGEEADMIYRLVRGVVRTSHVLPDGRRKIGDFYYAGETVGLEVGTAHLFSAEALTSCEIQALRRSVSTAYGAAEIDRLVLDAASSELGRAQTHMLLLGRSSACEKVARFLLDLARRMQSERVALPMSRQDMADYLGLTMETISRMLHRLEADGLVEFSGRRTYRIRRPGELATLAAA